MQKNVFFVNNEPKGNKGQRDLLLKGLIKAEIRTLNNREKSLRIRALQLAVASFTRRHEVSSSEVERLRARLVGLTGSPNPDDAGSDVFDSDDNRCAKKNADIFKI